MVIKALAISKITYLFINLPDPDDHFLKELNRLFFEFLWNGKHSKISKANVCQTYQNGGIKMLDIYSFLSTMKITCLKRLSLPDSTLKQFVYCLYPSVTFY